MAETLVKYSWPAYAQNTFQRLARVAARRRPSWEPPARTLVERWRDALGLTAALSAALAVNAAWADAEISLLYVVLYAASCAIRAQNPIAWGALPYAVVASDSKLSCPLADQLVSHVGESAFGLLMGRYCGSPLLAFGICVVARGSCWRGVLGGGAAAHAVEECCWLLAASTVAAHALSAGHRDVGVYFAAYAVGLAVWDIPMYLIRDHNAKPPDAGAVRKSLMRPKVDVSFETWRADMPWLSVYFVLGPWGGLLLHQRIVA